MATRKTLTRSDLPPKPRPDQDTTVEMFVTDGWFAAIQLSEAEQGWRYLLISTRKARTINEIIGPIPVDELIAGMKQQAARLPHRTR